MIPNQERPMGEYDPTANFEPEPDHRAPNPVREFFERAEAAVLGLPFLTSPREGVPVLRFLTGDGEDGLGSIVLMGDYTMMRVVGPGDKPDGANPWDESHWRWESTKAIAIPGNVGDVPDRCVPDDVEIEEIGVFEDPHDALGALVAVWAADQLELAFDRLADAEQAAEAVRQPTGHPPRQDQEGGES